MKRREFLALLTAALGAPAVAFSETLAKTTRIDNWSATHDRVFLGGGFWANPMEDWRVQDGWAACQNAGGGRNIQSLLYDLADPTKPFTVSVEVGRPDDVKNDGGAGLRIGIQSDIDDHRANCFASSGLQVGVKGDRIMIGGSGAKLAGPMPARAVLMLIGKPMGDKVELTLTVAEPETGKVLGKATAAVPAEKLKGNIALASQFTGPNGRPGNAGYRFRDWQLSGEAFKHHPDRAFGPILWSMYSLSDNRDDDRFVMKLTALLGPMGAKDNKTVELEAKQGGSWKKIASAQLDPDAWTATFRVANWDEKQATPYRVVYREKHSDGSEQSHTWTGTIRANPTKPLRIGALTCQNAVGFPYKPVSDNLVNLDPDLLYFSGDQLYEAHGGFGVIRNPADPAILNYLRKFYMFGWSFREAMANTPTICLPDDHDVFHGNIWGEGGAALEKGSTSSSGGYIQPAKMVNVVHKTNCSHHPDFASPRPVKQDISVYYGDMVYGGVGFAIIADRQWKSGPGKSGNKGGRVDHVSNPDVDTSTFDKDGLVLLGERQEKFLEEWADDWRGHTMKVVLSQTVFAGVATHHGGYNGYLVADLDSGAWPQTPRNRAIDIMRPAMPLHICGDQHLASAVQYGVEKQRDSFWAFCTPAITVGYQRWWRPDEVGMPHTNRPQHNLPNTGEFIDGMGNKVYVYTSANPVQNFREGGGNRYDFAHRKNSGFGLVTIDTNAKTYKLECFKFLIDATDGKASNQFPGWPLTIQQSENKGENRIK
jgi:phosphodiesterase/alkaline phosphatase D-like protein